MKAYKMTGSNGDNHKRVRYCFANSYSEAVNKFETEYWYIHIAKIRECPASEVSINGVNN